MLPERKHLEGFLYLTSALGTRLVSIAVAISMLSVLSTGGFQMFMWFSLMQVWCKHYNQNLEEFNFPLIRLVDTLICSRIHSMFRWRGLVILGKFW